MKNSPTPEGSGNAVLRLSRLVLAALLACGTAMGCGPEGQQAPTQQGPRAQPSPSGAPGPQAQQGPRGQQGPQGAQSGVVGTWRTTVPNGTITMTYEANGLYNQIEVTNTGVQEDQGGPYQLIAPNTIVLTVTDWSPKSHLALVPCGTPGDPTCNVERVVANPQPPGSRYAYTFNGPNTMIFTNEQAQETIRFSRVMQ